MGRWVVGLRVMCFWVLRHLYLEKSRMGVTAMTVYFVLKENILLFPFQLMVDGQGGHLIKRFSSSMGLRAMLRLVAEDGRMLCIFQGVGGRVIFHR